jgi:hypothetical protein
MCQVRSTQCPHNSRTPAQPRVRSLCTRAARGCPAGGNQGGTLPRAPQGFPQGLPPAPLFHAPSGPAQAPLAQAGTSRRGKELVSVQAVWSACGLQLPRCARHTTAPARSHPARNIRRQRPPRTGSRRVCEALPLTRHDRQGAGTSCSPPGHGWPRPSGRAGVAGRVKRRLPARWPVRLVVGADLLQLSWCRCL